MMNIVDMKPKERVVLENELNNWVERTLKKWNDKDPQKIQKLGLAEGVLEKIKKRFV